MAKFEARRTEGLVFLLILLIRGLAPFHFQAEANHFNWIPFAGFLGTEWQSGILVFLEKGFYYGSAIWLSRRAAFNPWQTPMVVAAILAAIEIFQIHLPGRTAEITDPLLALILGFGMKVLASRTA